MNILAIDPALVMGVAHRIEDENAFTLVDFNKERKLSRGDVYAELDRRMHIWMPTCDVLAIEEPCPKNMVSARMQYGLLSVCEGVAAKLDKVYQCYNPRTVKKFAEQYNNMNATRRELAELHLMFEKALKDKIQTLIYFYLTEGRVVNHNIADAAAILGLARQELSNVICPRFIQWQEKDSLTLSQMGC